MPLGVNLESGTLTIGDNRRDRRKQIVTLCRDEMEEHRSGIGPPALRHSVYTRVFTMFTTAQIAFIDRGPPHGEEESSEDSFQHQQQHKSMVVCV